MGFVNDDGNKFRLDGAIDFDLHITEVGVVVHAGDNCQDLKSPFRAA